MEATRKKEEQEMVGKIQMEAERKIAKLNKHMKLQIKEGLPTDNLGTKGVGRAVGKESLRLRVRPSAPQRRRQ